VQADVGHVSGGAAKTHDSAEEVGGLGRESFAQAQTLGWVKNERNGKYERAVERMTFSSSILASVILAERAWMLESVKVSGEREMD